MTMPKMYQNFNVEDQPDKIKIRWINPLGVTDFDKPIAEVIKTIKMPKTEVEVISLKMENSPHDLGYSCYEGLVIADIVRVTRDAAMNNFDGIVIGCFYDLALREARNISGNAVVVAPCQASVEIVSNLANKFSVIVGLRSWIDEMEDRIKQYGYGNALASFRPVGLSVEEFHQDPERTKRLMIEQAVKAVDDDYAEAIILGCTIGYGFYEEIQDVIDVPVIDCTLAAFKTAEHLAHMKRLFNWNPSRRWGCESPPEQQLKEWKIFDEPAPIGGSIWIT